MSVTCARCGHMESHHGRHDRRGCEWVMHNAVRCQCPEYLAPATTCREHGGPADTPCPYCELIDLRAELAETQAELLASIANERRCREGREIEQRMLRNAVRALLETPTTATE